MTVLPSALCCAVPDRKTGVRTLYVGDIHCDFASFEIVAGAVLEVLTGIERVVQVGDFGFWADARPWRVYSHCRLPVPVFFIDGNHEDNRTLHGSGLTEPGAIDPACDALYIPRGYVADGVVYMGGGTSIDRPQRTAGADWFPEENLTEEEVSAAIRRVNAASVRVMVAHETTRGAFHSIRQPGWGLVDRNRDLLEELFLAACPRVYVHGHYHFHREYEYLGCRFFSLSNPDRYQDQLAGRDPEAILSVARECCVVVDAEGNVYPF